MGSNKICDCGFYEISNSRIRWSVRPDLFWLRCFVWPSTKVYSTTVSNFKHKQHLSEKSLIDANGHEGRKNKEMTALFFIGNQSKDSCWQPFAGQLQRAVTLRCLFSLISVPKSSQGHSAAGVRHLVDAQGFYEGWHCCSTVCQCDCALPRIRCRNSDYGCFRSECKNRFSMVDSASFIRRKVVTKLKPILRKSNSLWSRIVFDAKSADTVTVDTKCQGLFPVKLMSSAFHLSLTRSRIPGLWSVCHQGQNCRQ